MLAPAALIARTRDGHPLAPGEIRAFVDAYTRGDVPDYQMSAWLMAVYLRGLTDAEASALVSAMLHSGTVVDLSDVPGRKVDKHSTGGVGDKVSLLLAPLVAACGSPVPMISGRGLGHTGGTLDKLESIPGFTTGLSLERYRQQLADLGVVMIGQTPEIAPADRKLYALRDVTATVESIPLIAASIMSKKLAAGLDALVLDVKVGRGAFMQTTERARELARAMVAIGAAHGVETTALLTRMDAPLGSAAGNWPEVAETVRCLRGETRGADDVIEVTLALAGEMLRMGGAAQTTDEGRAQAQAALSDGRAWERFVRLVEAQGGNARSLDRPERRQSESPSLTVEADRSGVVAGIHARAIGELTVALGAGRRVKEDAVDPLAGVVLHARTGDRVERDQPLATLYTRRTSDADAFREAARAAFEIGENAPDLAPLIVERITAEA
jgi:pyrimidine-nucleoside phosphorylase